MSRRVVITGMGAVTPIGLSVRESWDSCVNGRSGLGRITLFDPTNFPIQIGGELKNFDPANYMDAKEARRRDRFEQMGVAAAKEALTQSGLVITDVNAGRIGSFVSSAVGGAQAFQEASITMKESGPRRINPFTIPMMMVNGAAGMVAIDFGTKGPAMCITSACAAGADSIGMAALLIKAGRIDAALAGGAEASIVPTGIAAFDRVGALSRRNEDFSMTPQPFDKNRDGLLMGEGAAVVMVEGLDHAQARGANIICELIGYGSTNDAFHITAPSEDGAGAAGAMVQALADAQLHPDQIDYISAHGTATHLNDLTETKAIKLAFGEQAYRIPISSTKSMTGHMIAATAALEIIFCALAIRDGVIPPTIHYQTPDPECDLDYVPNTAREKKVEIAMSNAFGFGGHNAVVIVKRFTG
jgi:beta-ketoacyl-acyl-carrier-protein synthase II